MRTLLLAAALFISAFAQAEDTPFVHLLGYSDDGRWMAFQEVIQADGSGNYHSSIRVLDTKNDQYFQYSSPTLKDYEEVDGVSNPMTFSAFAKRAQDKAKSILDSKGIKKSNGQQLMVSTAPNVSAITYKDVYLSLYKRETAVTVSPERFAKCESYKELIPDLGENKLLGYEVEAYNIDDYAKISTGNFGGSKKLHSDSQIYESRGCPQGYSLNSAMAHGDQVVLLVSVQTHGFEGPDISFITLPFNIKDVK